MVVSPCRAKGDYVITSSLGHGNGMSNGEVDIVDQRTNTVVSKLEIAKLLGEEVCFWHFHSTPVNPHLCCSVL